jgi:hypothetical protein
VTPQQAQELADLIDELASEHAQVYHCVHEANHHGGVEYPSIVDDIKARLVRLLESVHAG